MPIYLDCNSTAPLDASAREAMLRYFDVEYGNAGSRTHEYGLRAKQAVEAAREKVAAVVDVQADDVIFTSGATESNNLAILGLAAHGEAKGARHIVSTAIEHKAVLEPLDALRKRGFEVTLVKPDATGVVSAENVSQALRPDTLLVTVMQVNNETGIIQPLDAISEALRGHDTYFHVDAAQGFGKELSLLKSSRIDLISISAHKIYGPKGVGALITRRRGFQRPPLSPILFGGGQERGVRPGTLPVPLIAGFGAAAEAALREHTQRTARNKAFRAAALAALSQLNIDINGDPDLCLPTTLNISIPGLDAEAVMLALKHVIAISNGSACTSSSYQPSHVLAAMSLPPERIAGAVRLSWCHMTEDVDWSAVIMAVRRLQ